MLGTSVLVAGVGDGVSLNSLAVNSIWWVLLWLGVRHDPSGNCDGEGCRVLRMSESLWPILNLRSCSPQLCSCYNSTKELRHLAWGQACVLEGG